jgi:hypothetical protein
MIQQSLTLIFVFATAPCQQSISVMFADMLFLTHDLDCTNQPTTDHDLWNVDMALNEQKTGRSVTSHLDITFDSKHPPPAASQAFTQLREHATTAWDNFETSENLIVQLDDAVDTDILNYVSLHPRVSASDLRTQKAHFIICLYEPRIKDVETYCQQLETTVKGLADAALKEPETLEGRVTAEVDAEVMRKCLATARDIVQVAQAQLDKARLILNPG